MIRLLAQILALLGIVIGTGWATLTGLHLWQTPIVLDAPTPTTASVRPLQEIADPVPPALSEFSQSLARPLFLKAGASPSAVETNQTGAAETADATTAAPAASKTGRAA